MDVQEEDFQKYYGMMKQLNISEKELGEKARAHPKIPPHVADFVEAGTVHSRVDLFLAHFDAKL